MKYTAYGFLVLFCFFVLSVFFGVWNYTGRVVDNAVETAHEQFDPSVLLKKYEWFKDAAAALDKKNADMRVYAARLKTLEESYKGSPRRTWARDDREQYNIWASEEAGVKASFNQVAAEYNAQMAKFNYRFTNVGDLPGGATDPLPREFKPYQTN